MKKFLASIMAVSLCMLASGQIIDYTTPKPFFQGGDANGFKKWVDERIVYDENARAEGVHGRVMLQFTIEPDGSLDKVRILRGLDPRLDAEAVKVVSSSPKWEWHTDNPRPITYTFPVIFDHGKENPYPCEVFRYDPEKKRDLKIYCVSHGSIVIKTGRWSIFIDPVMKLGEDVHEYGWFRPSPDKVILLTHEHHDHLSKETVDYLTEGMAPDSYSIYGNGASIEALGEGIALGNGDAVTLPPNAKTKSEELKIKAVAAYNTTRDHLKFHPEGHGNGYLIEIGELVIYVAGDTEVIPEMKHLGKVDVAFLPVNQPYTMTPKQCIKAARTIKPGVLIPYHMGDTDMSPVSKALDNSGIRLILHDELR